MTKNPSALITRKQFLVSARKLCAIKGIDYSEWRPFFKRLFSRLLSQPAIRREQIEQPRKIRKTMLDRIQDPHSKHYDDTPDLTALLSLIWYRHQKNLGRISAHKITKHERQWTILVNLKRFILNAADNGGIPFQILANEVFIRAEELSIEYGKRSVYLTFVSNKAEELVTLVQKKMEESISEMQERIFNCYKDKRNELTRHPWKRQLVSGSADHVLVQNIEQLCDEYGLTILEFMNLHFEAFAIHESFPTLRDLCSDKGIDRIDRYLMKSGDRHVRTTKEDEEYWKTVSRLSH